MLALWTRLQRRQRPSQKPANTEAGTRQGLVATIWEQHAKQLRALQLEVGNSSASSLSPVLLAPMPEVAKSNSTSPISGP